MIIERGSKLLMIGDSITDCGRARSVDEAADHALGDGYVALTDAWLRAAYPARPVRVVNRGIGGDTVRDLRTRWQTDVLALTPDWLSIFIGINDVWRWFGDPAQRAQHVSLDEYAATLEQLVSDTRPQLQGLVLLTPFLIEPDTREPMRAMMDRYGKVVADVAARYDAILIDTQAAFDAVLEYVPPMALSLDRVHPFLTGHMILARAFLRGIGAA
ncbi:MAG: SGNH/GDSL hydrolase family protein [Candidatus Promineofilum sp.]|nr:SGNH/GDSL hydrolase family protein [Promineifilum sp.]